MSTFLTEVWTHHNEDAIHQQFEGTATGLWPDESGIDPDGFLQFFRALSPLLKDVRLEFLQWHESEEHLWLRWFLRCKHWKKSEKLIELPCAATTRFRDGKLVECNNYQDFMHLFAQLELVPEQAFEYGLAGTEILEEEERRTEALAPSEKGQTHFLWPGFQRVSNPKGDLYIPCSSRQLSMIDLGQDLLLPDEEQLGVLFESKTFAMVLVDHEDRILECDESFAELIDRFPKTLPGLSFRKLLLHDDQSTEKAFFDELVAGKRVHYRHRVRLMRGNTIIWAQISVARIPIRKGGSRIVRAIQEASRVEELVEFQEHERKLLSRELHDGLAQELATLWVHLQTGTTQAEPSPALLKKCLKVVDRMSEELRTRMRDLRSPILEGKSLSEALEALLSRLSSEHQLSVQKDFEKDIDEIDCTLAIVVYRVIQEAIRNVVKHSGAKRCLVSVRKRNALITGAVADNGRGFDPRVVASKNRLGLIGMKERCELVGGTLRMTSKAGLGTTISFELREIDTPA